MKNRVGKRSIEKLAGKGIVNGRSKIPLHPVRLLKELNF